MKLLELFAFEASTELAHCEKAAKLNRVSSHKVRAEEPRALALPVEGSDGNEIEGVSDIGASGGRRGL